MTLENVLKLIGIASRAISRETRRAFHRLFRRYDYLPPDEILIRARHILAQVDPVLAGAIEDSLLAAWLAAAKPVIDAIPAEPLAEPLAEPWLPTAGAGEATKTARGLLDTLRTAPPPPGGQPPDLLALPEFSEPIIRFPKIEAATADLLNRRIVHRFTFDALADEAKRSAFTVSRVVVSDTIERIGEALADAVETGGTLKHFRDAVDAVLSENGEAPLSRHHLETIFRTNVQNAYATGQDAIMRHPLVGNEFPYAEYSATHDSRTRPEHLALEKLGLNGTAVYRSDDPFWETFGPPWDYNCRCLRIFLSIEDAAAKGVHEAREWLRTGEAPARPQWVATPPFSPPAGWARRRSLAPII